LERAAALAAALCLTGCGGGDEREPPPRPKLSAALASSLAERSDAVAAALDAGNSCRAVEEAERLRDESIASVNSGRIPTPFQEPLLGRVNELVERIECVPPSEPVGHDDEKKKKKEEKDEKDERGKDERKEGEKQDEKKAEKDEKNGDKKGDE